MRIEYALGLALLLGGCFAEIVDPESEGDPDASTGSVPTEDPGSTSEQGSSTGADPVDPSTSVGGSSTTGADEESSSGPGCLPGSSGCPCDADVCDAGVCRDGLCVEPSCGDGRVEGDEICDDGNEASQDGCESDCTPSTGVAKVAAGDQFACALFHDGRLRCWGNGSYAKLGYGTVDHVGDDETPATMGDVDVGAPVLDVACGREHTCVILEGGAVRCWGFNNRWQLGIPSYSLNEVIGDDPDELPAALPDVNLGGTAVALTAGSWTTYALMDDGTVRCFGLNAAQGRCGYGTDEDVIGDDEHPVLAGPVDLGGVATAIDSHADHACAVLDDGTMRCWGLNEEGALGLGHTDPIGDDETPGSVPALAFDAPIAEVQTGLRHTCVRQEDGVVKCWGRNTAGQLGLGHTNPVLDAHDDTLVSLGGPAVDLAVGGGHGCAILDDGAVRCWGDANFGRLGYGDSSNDVGDDELPDSQNPLELAVDTIYDLEVGNSFSCARVDEGQVMCWGANSSGQIGQPGVDYFGDHETLGGLSPIALEG